MTRRGVIGAGGVAAGAGALGLSGWLDGGNDDDAAASYGEGNNVVLIMIDTLRSDHVGAYGSDRVKTPNIDALAKDSLRFTTAVPEAMPTVPSRRAVYTSRRSFPFRDWKAEPQLPQAPGWMSVPADRMTWIKWAREAGLTTAISTDVPFLVGPRFEGMLGHFDEVNRVEGEPPLPNPPKKLVGDDVLSKYLIPALKGTEQETRLRQFLTANPPGRPEREHLGPKTFRGAMRLLDKLKREERFALVIDTFAPHEAWDPPKKYIELYDDAEFDGIEPIQPFSTPFSMVEDLDIDDRTLERARNLYAAEVSFVDAWVGRFLDKLEDLRLADRTTVLLTADHGVTLGERGVLGKRPANVFSEIYQVPYLIRDPGGRSAGDTSGFYASTHDIGPTLLAAAGVRPFGAAAGEDLTQIFEGNDPPPRSVFTASYADHVLAGDDDWFLIADNRGDQKRLFRRSDEMNDLASEEPKQVERLWDEIIDAARGPLPEFGEKGVVGL